MVERIFQFLKKSRFFCNFLPVLCVNVYRKLKYIAVHHTTFVIITSTILLCTFYPVRYPNMKSYDVVPESEILDDIEMCIFERSKTENFRFCQLFLEQLDVFRDVDQRINDSILNEMPAKLNIKPGGRWSPPNCKSWQRVAIIVPYRNREKHLKIFLQHMHPFLHEQFLDYGIFIVEQKGDSDFNRGQLLNIGFEEASKDHFCCFIFHDVDLLPQSPRHYYGCSSEPRHMCSAVDIFRYNLLYPELFGGVVAFTKQQFELVNGYSNLYYGWGAEDDDLYERVIAKGMKINRWESRISRYVMLQHGKAHRNPERFNLLKTSIKRIDTDGLNSLVYESLDLKFKPLYTHIIVDLKQK